MKISIVAGPWLPVPAVQGGAMARVWQGLAEVFATRGHEVTIMARTYKGQMRHEIINGVTYFRHSGFSQGRYIAVDLLKDLAYALSITPRLPAADILVINDFWTPALAQWLRRNVGKIVVNVNRFPKGQFFLYSGVAQFAAASNVIGEAIATQCPSMAQRVRVFPNPIDTSTFSSPTMPRRSRAAKTILYVGRIHPEKGIHVLVESFFALTKNFPQVKLQIVGPVKTDEGGGGQSYLRQVQSLACGTNVEFLEPVYEQRCLAEIYHQADLFCYPSLAEKGEAFPVAPLEAMATGLVPLVSDLQCFRDYIDEGRTGYYFDHRGPGAASKLADVMQMCLRAWDQTLQMGIDAAQRAKTFSYENIGDLYLRGFQQLLANHSSDILAKGNGRV